jgi:glycosyltransferase involved in cell wall biosynthesis
VILGGRVDEDEKNSGDLVREQLMSLIAEKHFENRVLLPGKAGNMTEWYQRADIFVLSSRFEGFPNVLLEAMASGTACVSFNCDTGPGDLIQHGINGMLVEVLNTKELGMAVYEVMKQSGLRKKLADNAIKVRNTFSEEKIMKLWIEIFRELN